MEHKIIFAGPVGSGKTTSISSVSDIMVVGTEAKASDDVAQRKSNTTVAMDYGILNLDNGKKVHLYGTPGQDRFNFMWEILSEHAMGFVILIDSARPDPIADLKYYLEAFRKPIEKSGNAVVIGVTRTELIQDIDLIDRCLSSNLAMNLNIPVFEVDGRERQDVKHLLMALMALIETSKSH